MNVDEERGDISPVMLSGAKHDMGGNSPQFSQPSSSRPYDGIRMEVSITIIVVDQA